MFHRTILLTLLIIVATALPVRSTSNPLVDSLLVWRNTARLDLVENHATPAIAAARAVKDSTTLLSLLLIRGGTRAGSGQARQAEADLREAMALADHLDNAQRYLQCIRWLSVAVGRQGRGDEAAELYRKLELLAQAADDSLHLGWAWVGTAYDHHLSGRPAMAVDYYVRAADVLERHGEIAGALWASNGLGMALRQTGRYNEAREAFANVLALAKVRGDVVNTATALDNLGRLDLQLGDPGLAEQRFAQAAAIHRRHQHHREGLVPCIDMAEARQMQGRYDIAEALLDSVLTVARGMGLRDLEVLAANKLADVHMAQGRPGAAAALNHEILAGQEMPSLMADTETRLRLAQSLAYRDSSITAVKLLEEISAPGSVGLELKVAILLGDLLLSLSNAEQAVMVLEPALAKARACGADVEQVELLTHLGRAAAELDRREEALANYSEAVDIWEKVRSLPTDPAWRELRGTVAGSLFAQAAALLMEDPNRTEEAWSLVQRYRARTLQERMNGPETIAVSAIPVPDLSIFRRQILRPGEVWLEIVEGKRSSVMFCITPDTIQAGLLPGRQQTQPRMQRLGDVVTSRDLSEPEPAAALARSLLADWPSFAQQAFQGAKRVLWCPDGTWHQYPVVLSKFKVCITRVPAAAVLTRLRHEHRTSAKRARILAFAGPDPHGTDLLPGAKAEVLWFKNHLRNVETPVLSSLNADISAWKEVDVIHLAAHTELNALQPWNTSISLGRTDSAQIRAKDIAKLELTARLVVLTGCTTVGSRLIGGEGMIGLTGGFLSANVSTVLATLWPVDDAAALHMTTSFYEGLADGLTADMALARARCKCCSRRELASPCHWAGFTLVGDGDILVPVRRRMSRWPLAVTLGILAIAIFARYRYS